MSYRRKLELIRLVEDFLSVVGDGTEVAEEFAEGNDGNKAVLAVRELRKLIDDVQIEHEHGYTYMVRLDNVSSGMTLGPRLAETGDQERWLLALAENAMDWITNAGAEELARTITHVDLANTECFTLGKECPDHGCSEPDVYEAPS